MSPALAGLPRALGTLREARPCPPAVETRDRLVAARDDLALGEDFPESRDTRAMSQSVMELEQRLVGVRDAAKILGVSHWTIRKAAAEGTLRAVRFRERGHLHFRSRLWMSLPPDALTARV